MADPIAPKTLTAQELRDLREKLAHTRHEINNQLSLIVASLEMIRFKPEMRDRMIDSLTQQPLKIQQELSRFADELEKALGFPREMIE